jgi:hypothetical protein
MGRIGAFLSIFVAALVAPAVAEPAAQRHLNARHVPAEFHRAAVVLLAGTKQPVVFPANMDWAHTTRPLVGCPRGAERDRYAYYVFDRGGCTEYDDPMFVWATLDVRPWTGPYWNYDTKVDLGRGVDGDVTFATGFDDPGEPRTDDISWHLGRTSYSLNVSFGDAIALARSIVANLTAVPKSRRLTEAPPVAVVAARYVEPGLAEGVAVLRRRPTVPIEVPRSPAIDSNVHLYVNSHDRDGYAYFLCRTVACSPKGGIVAEVSADAIGPRAEGENVGREPANVDLSCGFRGHFQGQIADAGDVPSAVSIVTWKQGQTDFTILSARDNPAHTDVVALARSMISNACREKKSREP